MTLQDLEIFFGLGLFAFMNLIDISRDNINKSLVSLGRIQWQDLSTTHFLLLAIAITAIVVIYPSNDPPIMPNTTNRPSVSGKTVSPLEVSTKHTAIVSTKSTSATNPAKKASAVADKASSSVMTVDKNTKSEGKQFTGGVLITHKIFPIIEKESMNISVSDNANNTESAIDNLKEKAKSAGCESGSSDTYTSEISNIDTNKAIVNPITTKESQNLSKDYDHSIDIFPSPCTVKFNTGIESESKMEAQFGSSDIDERRSSPTNTKRPLSLLSASEDTVTSKISESDVLFDHPLIRESAANPKVLVGKRIYVNGYGNGIITKCKRRMFSTTHFKIELEDQIGIEVILPLKRSKMKGSVVFRVVEDKSSPEQLQKIV